MGSACYAGHHKKDAPIGASSCGCGWWLRHLPPGTHSFHSSDLACLPLVRRASFGAGCNPLAGPGWVRSALLFALPSLLQQKAFTLLALALGCAVALASSVMAHPDHQQATQQGNPAAQHEHDHDHSHDQAPR